MNKLVIVFNGVEHTIEVREKDGYINATQICKLINRDFNDYKRLKCSLEFIKYKKSIHKNEEMELIDIKKGGINQGTWVHIDVAYHIIRWIDPNNTEYIQNNTTFVTMISDRTKTTEGWLYFIQFKESIERDILCIKVGKTTNLQQRIKTHNRSSFFGLNVFFCCKVINIDKSEKELINYCINISEQVSPERFLIKDEQVCTIIDKMKSMMIKD